MCYVWTWKTETKTALKGEAGSWTWGMLSWKYTVLCNHVHDHTLQSFWNQTFLKTWFLRKRKAIIFQNKNSFDFDLK